MAIATSAKTTAIPTTTGQRREVLRAAGRGGGGKGWRREGAQPLDEVLALRHDADDHDGFVQSFKQQGTAVLVPDAIHPSREVRDFPRGEDLPGPGLATEPGREVQGSAPVATLDRNRLARVQPDPERERHLRLAERLLHEPPLEVHRGADRLPG